MKHTGENDPKENPIFEKSAKEMNLVSVKRFENLYPLHLHCHFRG
jgi:hypothetical protein